MSQFVDQIFQIRISSRNSSSCRYQYINNCVFFKYKFATNKNEFRAKRDQLNHYRKKIAALGILINEKKITWICLNQHKL